MHLSFMMLVVHVCTLSIRVTKMHIYRTYFYETQGEVKGGFLWDIGVLPHVRCMFWQFISLFYFSVLIPACVYLSVTKSINTKTPLYNIHFPFPFSLALALLLALPSIRTVKPPSKYRPVTRCTCLCVWL